MNTYNTFEEVRTEAFRLLKEYNIDTQESFSLQVLMAQLDKELLTQKEPVDVPFSEQELQELMEGEKFTWNYGGVDLHIFKED